MPLKKEYVTTIDEFLQNPDITDDTDATAGDIILFTEAVFEGYYPKSTYEGDRRILAKVLKESYGKLKGQHTFSLEVLDSDGYDPLPKGTKIRRLGRNVYRKDFYMLPLATQEQREEKHQRKEKANQRKYYNWLSEADGYLDELYIEFNLNERYKLLNKARYKLDKVYKHYNELDEGLKDLYQRINSKYNELKNEF